jgi:FkbH-like protein
MEKKINIISNFNVNNICNLISSQINCDCLDFSYSDIFQTIKKKYLKNNLNVLIFDIEFYNYNVLNSILEELKIKKIEFILIPLIIEDMFSGYKIVNNNENISCNKIRNFENLFISKFNDTEDSHLLNMNHLIVEYNSRVFDQKLWFLCRNPFLKKFELFLSAKISQLINLKNFIRKKAIFIDLDDTLWGGEIAEIGFKNIKIGQEDAISQAFYKLQKVLKKLNEEGIILGIISKNYEDTALKGFENKKMLLRKEDFAGWEINFKKKSDNIVNLCKRINISLDSVVFLDNSNFERNEIRSKLKNVLVPELPDEPYEYYKIILNNTNTNYIKLNKEDLIRKNSYKSKYIETNKTKISHSDWLKSLEMECTIEKLSKKNIERCAQMQQKINQINLSTRRLSLKEIQKENKSRNIESYTFSLKDKFTDLGMVSLITIKHNKNNIDVIDFLMSCRVFGRDLEKYIFNFLSKKFLKNIEQKINFKFMKTKKNKLCYEILKNNLEVKKDNMFLLKKKNYKFLPFVNLAKNISNL